MNKIAPVITIDGPGGSGKGTIARRLAEKLGWHLLDSGCLYRAVAWAALKAEIAVQEEEKLALLLDNLDLKIINSVNDHAYQVICNGKEITGELASETCAAMASQLAVKPMVRTALLNYQRRERKWPGLVADGRDMGTVIFPDASIKFYFAAALEERARRRCKQLEKKGLTVDFEQVMQELKTRDQRDQERELAPAKPAADVITIDTSMHSVDEVFSILLEHVKKVISLCEPSTTR